MPTHQFRLAYADYGIPVDQAEAFRGELLEELLDRSPTVAWQRVADLGGGRFYAALDVHGDEREAAAALASAMERARATVRAAR